MCQHGKRNLLHPVIALIVTAVVGLTLIAGQISAGPNSPLSPESRGWDVQDTGLYGDEIEMVSSIDGWVLRPWRGGEGQGGFGYLYRYNGNQWSSAGSLPYSQEVRLEGAIAMTSANDGWVALGPVDISPETEPTSTIYHWNGNTWTLHATITEPATASWPGGISLTGIDMLFPSDGWMVGTFTHGTRFYHWDGVSWQHDTTLMNVYAESDIDMVSANNGWAVGLHIAHWDGESWTQMPGPEDGWLFDISALDENNAWAVGGIGQGTGLILHWDGVSWTEVPSPASNTLRAIDMTSADDGWAVGFDEGVAYHWNGVEWTQVPLPTAANEYFGLAIDMLSESHGWMVGYKSVGNGVILSYEVRQELTTNHADGAPGSFFTFTGSDFPSNEEAIVNVNGHDLGTVTTDENGAFTFILSTAEADEGIYIVTVSVNPSATSRFVLDEELPLRPQDGTGTEIPVPADIALTEQLFLPAISR